ncbi:argininosuccinate lyase [Ectobacillus ponti]|uniref:Argininosuccinate lyase n=1 Tax=Ectobacillus ponti TaxID=2961894 RepID=A0AA42BPI9_9BACI|nr:argininosuccinate lyase [Ectobacillus ponti]MCP8969175.1 argininosuccinate lyase [Ectobacillus ponti]
MTNRKQEFMKQEGTVFPGKTYAEQLLAPIFRDQRDYLYKEMLAVQRVHVLMLYEQGIISREDGKEMLRALLEAEDADLTYDPRYEDVFFLLEARLEQTAGCLAGNMHIGKSRNDMGVTMYRLALRRRLALLLEQVLVLQESVLCAAEEHAGTIMPAYTHTQPAQPTTLGHYLLAVHDVLQRDMQRLLASYDTVNLSPLGAAALATTGFPINRHRTAELLGFAGLAENSYDAIAGADYILAGSAAVLTMMTNTGRVVQDLLLQATKEFGGILVAAPYVQISSIMPQKRNPVSLEHARALSSSACGEALVVFHMIHNTPFGDIVDTEDDLQPHLYRSIEQALRALKLLDAVIRTMEVDVSHLAEKAQQHSITITELADVLAREKGIPFRQAHQLAARVAKSCLAEGKELSDLSAAEASTVLAEVELTDAEWAGIVSPAEFIRRRSVTGGPNLEEVKRMMAERKSRLQQSQQEVQSRQAAVEAAERLQQQLIQRLLS